MPKAFIFAFFFLFTFDLASQSNYDKAVLIPNFTNSDKYYSIINKAIFEDYKDNDRIHLFDWDESNHTTRQLRYNEIKRPISLVKYTSIKLSNFNLKPAIEIKTDTSGKTISVQFNLYPTANFATKTIEVKTSNIVSYLAINPSNTSSNLSTAIMVPKFLDEFGGDPTKIRKADSKQYDKLVEKLTEKLKPLFEERYKEFCIYYGSVLSSYIGRFNSEQINRSFKVIRNPEDDDEKKIKFITFDGARKDSLKHNNTLLLYQIVEFDNRKSTKFVDGFYVEDVGESKSTAKMSMWGNKKELAELLKGADELRLFTSGKAALEYNKSMNSNMVEYNVAVNKNCIFCDYGLESILLSIPVLNTIERNANELFKFQEMAKLGKYIDYNSQDLLNKQLGVKYLFYRYAGNLMSTDIETGKIIGSEGTYKNSSRTLVKNLFSETFDKKIEFLKNNEATKNKVKEIVLYSDFGFGAGEEMIIYTIEEEKVGNKILKRKVTIGEGKIKETISDFICVLKVKDGEKELFELQNQKKEFFLEYKIK
ncbi:MAG: hypothetical protein V4683_15330 [Bacteroidota bacterium]